MPNDARTRQLLEQLKSALAPVGFSKLRGQTLVRDVHAGSQMLHLSFQSHGELIKVACNIGARIDAVEDLVHRTLDESLLSKTERSRTATFGAAMSRLKPGERESWSVNYAEAIPTVAMEITECFLRLGVPFLRDYSEAPRLVPLLLGEDSLSAAAIVIPDEAAIRAVATEMLGANPENAFAVAKRAHQMVTRRSYPPHRFVQFCKKLGLEWIP